MRTKKKQPAPIATQGFESLPKFDALSPYNWDFRKTPEWALKEVIHYEYYRSWVEFRAAAELWMKQEFAGRPVRDWLMSGGHPSFDLNHSMMLSAPEAWRWHFESLREYAVYPLPWPWLFERGVFKQVNVGLRRNHAILTSDPMDRRRLEFIGEMLSLRPDEGSFGYHLDITFDGYRNEDIVAEFKLWLAQEAKKRRTVPIQGKAAATPWHWLKQLAAKRLHDAGQSYEQARDFVSQYQTKNRVNGAPDVLPIYSSPGAWHDAVKAGNANLERLKHNCHYVNWMVLPVPPVKR